MMPPPQVTWLTGPSGTVVFRYFLLEFEDPITGIRDDVEFLFSLNSPVVGYRSAPRAGSDDKRQRERIRDMRKRLEVQGWKSVGRAVGVNS
eukprot:scaffold97176_cov29-Tisochrysis_lutea.AAC.2